MFGVNELFGYDAGSDRTLFDKFVAFNRLGNLIISGELKNYIVVSNYQNKANAGISNKWICLSIHWDVASGAMQWYAMVSS